MPEAVQLRLILDNLYAQPVVAATAGLLNQRQAEVGSQRCRVHVHTVDQSVGEGRETVVHQPLFLDAFVLDLEQRLSAGVCDHGAALLRPGNPGETLVGNVLFLEGDNVAGGEEALQDFLIIQAADERAVRAGDGGHIRLFCENGRGDSESSRRVAEIHAQLAGADYPECGVHRRSPRKKRQIIEQLGPFNSNLSRVYFENI